MKLFSLLKAVFSQDMSLFKFKSKTKNRFKKILLFIFLFGSVGYSVGFYQYYLAEELNKINQTYLILSLSIFGVSILALFEGIYKSQNILFDCKDNDLLFSLPISRESILFVRIVKLLVFEFIFNIMFLVPTFIVYSMFESVDINFYIMSIIISILIPIIPTIIACFVGYFIKLFSSKSKSSKIVQTLLTTVAFVAVFFFLTSYDSIIGQMTDTISKYGNKFNYYYVIRAYIELIKGFNIITFIKLLLVNIIPFILFILIAKKYYFNIISNSKNHYKSKNSKVNIIVRKPLISLIIKELKRYFSSTVYMFNTAFGFILVFVVSIAGAIKGKTAVIELFKAYGISDKAPIEMIIYCLIFIALSMTSISSSSISLEGRTINYTKSLPINYKDVLKSKILSCLIIELPLILISIVVFTIGFHINLIYVILFILISIGVILVNANIGLLINLKHAKLDWNNETEVVKQSFSTMLSVYLAFPFMIIGGLLLFVASNMFSDMIAMTIHIGVMFIVSLILYLRLMSVGPKLYGKLSV